MGCHPCGSCGANIWLGKNKGTCCDSGSSANVGRVKQACLGEDLVGANIGWVCLFAFCYTWFNLGFFYIISCCSWSTWFFFWGSHDHGQGSHNTFMHIFWAFWGHSWAFLFGGHWRRHKMCKHFKVRVEKKKTFWTFFGGAGEALEMTKMCKDEHWKWG